jgi:hypothetical protein
MNPGDVIGFSGANWESDFLNLVTYGIPRVSISHVGIMADYKGTLLLFESTTINTSPCVIQKRPIRGAQAQYLKTRLESYEGRIWHYPLAAKLGVRDSQKLTDFLLPMLGTPYSEIEAVRAGGLAWSWFENRIHGPSGYAAQFCSEWVTSAHKDLGLFKIESPGMWSPNHLLRKELHLEILLKPRRLK